MTRIKYARLRGVWLEVDSLNVENVVLVCSGA